MNIFTYVIPFPTPYIKAVKLQGSVSTALQLIEVNHIPLQDIADVDVLAAYLLNMEPRDAALALVRPRLQVISTTTISLISLSFLQLA
jgi:hypothetical protein